jgi:hypothetical protein
MSIQPTNCYNIFNPARDMDEAMIEKDERIKIRNNKCVYLDEICFPSLTTLCCFFVTKIALYENLKFSSHTANRAKTSGCIVAGGVAVRAALEDW